MYMTIAKVTNLIFFMKYQLVKGGKKISNVSDKHAVNHFSNFVFDTPDILDLLFYFR